MQVHEKFHIYFKNKENFLKRDLHFSIYWKSNTKVGPKVAQVAQARSAAFLQKKYHHDTFYLERTIY